MLGDATGQDKTEEEKTHTQSSDAPSNARATVDSRFAEVYLRVENILNRPTPLDGSRIHAWLANGADPELDIYPTVKRIAAEQDAKGDPVTSLKFFDGAIMRAKADRTNPMPVFLKRDGPPATTNGAAPKQRFPERITGTPEWYASMRPAGLRTGNAEFDKETARLQGEEWAPPADKAKGEVRGRS
jgi:hypothetical protein